MHQKQKIPTGFGEVFLNPIKTSFELPLSAIFFCYPAFWARPRRIGMKLDFVQKLHSALYLFVRFSKRVPNPSGKPNLPKS